MNADLEAVLNAVDALLEVKVERVAGFLRDDGDLQTTYEALILALALTDPAEVIDLAFAGVVRAAKAKLAEEDAAADAAVNDSADV